MVGTGLTLGGDYKGGEGYIWSLSLQVDATQQPLNLPFKLRKMLVAMVRWRYQDLLKMPPILATLRFTIWPKNLSH